MNTNRDASDQTKYKRAKTLATYYQTTMNSVNTGSLVRVPGGYLDMSASTQTEVAIGKTECCSIDTSSTNTGSNDTPTYTTYYVSFTESGSTTWTAPATCQSPITYWIVGGGGGGAGAYDQRGNGGGGGGVAITGTYAVVAGTTYDVVVGAGGAGGTGQGTQSGGPGTGTHTDGADGDNSSFDSAGGGPVAAGGGKGLIGNPARQGGTSVGGVTTGGGGGGGGGSGGGGGGAGGNGTNGASGTPSTGGTGGIGVSFTIPGYNGGNPQVYSAGGNGGANPLSNFTVGADGSANIGNGGGGGSAASYRPPYAGGLIRMGGDGGSGLVVIQYSA